MDTDRRGGREGEEEVVEEGVEERVGEGGGEEAVNGRLEGERRYSVNTLWTVSFSVKASSNSSAGMRRCDM